MGPGTGVTAETYSSAYMEPAATTAVAEPAEPVAVATPAAAPIVQPAAQPPELEPTCDAAQPAQKENGSPWVLRLGNYLLNKKDPAADASEETPWAVRLGTYLEEKRPGPWSILANEKPHDPLVRPAHLLLAEADVPSDARSRPHIQP